MSVERDIYLTQSIETRAFEVTTVNRYGFFSGKPSVEEFQNPCDLVLSVYDGAARLHIAESGEMAGRGYLDLDHDQAKVVYEGLYMAVAAQQTYAVEPSDTMKAFTRLGGNVAGMES